jgi:hypothetical protein
LRIAHLVAAWCAAALDTDTWHKGSNAHPQRVLKLQGGEVAPQAADTWRFGFHALALGPDPRAWLLTQASGSADLRTRSEHGPPSVGSGVLAQIAWVWPPKDPNTNLLGFGYRRIQTPWVRTQKDPNPKPQTYWVPTSKDPKPNPLGSGHRPNRLGSGHRHKSQPPLGSDTDEPNPLGSRHGPIPNPRPLWVRPWIQTLEPFWVRTRTHPPTHLGLDSDLTPNSFGSGHDPPPIPLGHATDPNPKLLGFRQGPHPLGSDTNPTSLDPKTNPSPNPLGFELGPYPQPFWVRMRTQPSWVRTRIQPPWVRRQTHLPTPLGSATHPTPNPLGRNPILLGQASRPTVMGPDEEPKSIGSRGRTQCSWVLGF